MVVEPHSDTQQAVPDHYKPTFTSAQIAERVSKLAYDIVEWIDRREIDADSPVLAVCILRGGVHFFSDLVRAIPRSVEIGFVRASSYRIDTIGERAASVQVDDTYLDVRGRAVLLVDDICDSGNTLHTLSQTLLEHGAVSVCSVVLIQRLIEHSKHSPTWSAFRFSGDDWFVGYGMEDRNAYSNLDSVYTICLDDAASNGSSE